MSAKAVDDYISAQEEPKRSTLFAVRSAFLEIEPNLEQVIAWKSAMFKFNGKFVAGLCSHKAHLTYSPQSADVMAALQADLAGFITSKSSFQFAIDEPLPAKLLAKLLGARLSELNQ